MNHINGSPNLRNRYFGVRHGHSYANEMQIVSSNPSIGIYHHGLTKLGVEQATKTGLELKTLFTEEPLIFCSPFLRTRQTGEIIANLFNIPKPVQDERLRERNFGKYESQHAKFYGYVYVFEADDPDCTVNGVESANSVTDRTTCAIKSFEENYSNRTIILVSHGDPLAILETAFKRQNPVEYKRLSILATGEYREFILSANGNH